jgi:ferrochelatase
MSEARKAVLLVNLGSPNSTDEQDVRRYLREFLLDKRVIDVPYLLRKFLIEAFVLPKRPANSAAAYKRIWWDEGSPLVVLSERVKKEVATHVKLPVALAMRYGEPSIPDVLKALFTAHPKLEELLLVPLYPHYAMSSYETVVERVKEVVSKQRPQLQLSIQPPFYNDGAYLDAMAATIRPYLEEAPYDHLLFSYHGIPERHLRKSDPTNKHCLQSADCCSTKSTAHATCYRHQCFETTNALVERLQLKEGSWSNSFQSRLGRDPWLKPYTDFEVERFAQEGVKRLVVVCPSFVSDCLETLEEIGMEARDEFRKHGGEELVLVPCLNEQPKWIETLTGWIHSFDTAGKSVATS